MPLSTFVVDCFASLIALQGGGSESSHKSHPISHGNARSESVRTIKVSIVKRQRPSFFFFFFFHGCGSTATAKHFHFRRQTAVSSKPSFPFSFWISSRSPAHTGCLRLTKRTIHGAWEERGHFLFLGWSRDFTMSERPVPVPQVQRPARRAPTRPRYIAILCHLTGTA